MRITLLTLAVLFGLGVAASSFLNSHSELVLLSQLAELLGIAG